MSTKTSPVNGANGKPAAASSAAAPATGKRRKSAGGRNATAAAAPASPSPAEIQLLWQQSEEAYQKGRELYAQSDAFDLQIINAVGAGGSVILPNGQILRVVDNFLDASGAPKMKAFAPAGVSRFSVKVGKL